MKRLAILSLFLIAASPAREHYHWFPATENGKPRPWAVLLPRAAGIGQLRPGNQYVDFAKMLNARGIDALVIDYDRAVSVLKPKGNTGPQMASLVDDALKDARRMRRMDGRCPGLVVGWSRGGEGALTLAAAADSRFGLKAAIVYYPSVRGQALPYTQKLPILALQGTADSLAPSANLEKLAASRPDKGLAFQIRRYPGAGHRFDLLRPTDAPEASGLVKDYRPEAAKKAQASVAAFLDEQEIFTNSCALD